jgi:hypothetical protein
VNQQGKASDDVRMNGVLDGAIFRSDNASVF